MDFWFNLARSYVSRNVFISFRFSSMFTYTIHLEIISNSLLISVDSVET